MWLDTHLSSVERSFKTVGSNLLFPFALCPRQFSSSFGYSILRS